MIFRGRYRYNKGAYRPFKLRLETPDGEFKIFGGSVNIFLDPHATRMPVLGRDVLDHFTVIFDRRRNSILLLAEPDDYQLVK